MAIASIIRKSASSLCPLAGRLVRSQRVYSTSIFNALNNHSNFYCPPPLGTTFSSFRDFSSSKRPSSDEALIRVIESEVKCASETDDHDRVEEVPKGFPFEIQDNPGLQTITLKRSYQDEVISVEVHMPDLVTGRTINANDDDGDDDGGNKGNQSCIPLMVSVSKKNGPSLEFSCSAYPDDISIESLIVKHPEHSEDQIAYEGPDFHDLDENLQKAFHKYLEIRGIKPSTTIFLHEYMINKDSKEFLLWLTKLKNFVEA
ncbi:uncharacterized protein At2g39795, mitochondrial-like [Cucurbita pepo subsp. pepo]|uniref:uncharacterized protein At2g39795, mitochondrial-like n=1 Tax=Cucurbita pepo subsp. pepo TaxID=3664 RepID=UPI000C9D3F28|nr:uncharacterized protein At2g39795, mitochondrial-like [Cucurbita pepo subsp. pepo]XP_023518241.1 uncharacterized protein At2g39795, mitochondrial-like [Cucurbita pepo subsp. pepo]